MKNARYIMLATNAMIADLLNCENEAFIDMILTHIRDAIPFEEGDIIQWDQEEEMLSDLKAEDDSFIATVQTYAENCHGQDIEEEL